jgi:hypothetical protein
VKRLLILLLLKIETPSREIGKALNIHSSVIWRMLPDKEIGTIETLNYSQLAPRIPLISMVLERIA